MIKESRLFPQKVAEIGGKVKFSENFLKEKALPISFFEKETVEMSGRSYVILDFGREICGSVRVITAAAHHNTRLRLRTGESFSEASSTVGRKGATNDHATRDLVCHISAWSDNTFLNTGFRFLRIDHYGFGKTCFKCIIAQTRIYENTLLYTYTGKDEKIQKIFETAKYTIDLCGSSGLLWDGIKRDRLVWVGDMHPEVIAYTTLYGRTDIVEDSLEFARKATPEGMWINRINTYSMWWVIILNDYFKATQCSDFVARNMDYIILLGKQFDENLNSDGFFTDRSRAFVDWPTNNHYDKPQGVRALGLKASKSALELIGSFGGDDREWKSVLSKFSAKPIIVKQAKQIIALKYFATGEITSVEKARLIEGGAKGMSTFMSYYILKAVAETSGIEIATEMLKDYYCGMLSRGATTFWEDFDLDWLKGSGRIDERTRRGEKDLHSDYGAYCYKGFRHSFCHGWSGGVIAFIKEYLE